MKKLCSILITIVLVLTGFVSVIFFSVSSMTSEKVVNQVIDESDITDIADLITEDETSESVWDVVYQEAERYDISKEQVNEVLNDKTTKETIKDVINNILAHSFDPNQVDLYTEEELEEMITTLVKEANENYDLGLSVREEAVMIDNITPVLANATHSVTEVEEVTQTTNNELLTLVQELRDTDVKVVLLVIMIVGLILLVIINWKKKNFFSYFLGLFLPIGLFSLFYGLICQYAINLLVAEANNPVWETLIAPMKTTSMTIGIVSLAIAIGSILGIIFIKKKDAIPNQEVA